MMQSFVREIGIVEDMLFRKALISLTLSIYLNSDLGSSVLDSYLIMTVKASEFTRVC